MRWISIEPNLERL